MKVIGYFTYWDDEFPIENINFSYITHINYAFLIPKSDGTVLEVDDFKVRKLIELSHNNNVQVFISVGGWSYRDLKLSKVFEDICDNRKTLNKFIDNILEIVNKYNFDGVDMDWEFPSLKYVKEFEYLMEVLHSELKIHNKELSIAVPSGINVDNNISNIGAITSKIIDVVDWINLMIYDNDKEKDHSSFNFAKISVDYWLNVIKCPKSKVVLGLPFYSRPSCIPYNKLIEISKDLANKDNYLHESYNGIDTIVKKIELVKNQNIGGVMIWTLNYDTVDETSLLKAIFSHINNK